MSKKATGKKETLVPEPYTNDVISEVRESNGRHDKH